MSTAPHAEAERPVAVLDEMVCTVRSLACGCPTWALSEGEVSALVGRAQELRELCQTFTAVLAREAHSRGLGTDDGLSRADWLRGQADGLGAGRFDGAAAAAVARVGAALRDSRWERLADRVVEGEVSVGAAAAILRFHDDVAPVADPEHLAGIVDSMVEAADVLTGRELARLVAHARATVKPPAERDAEEAGLRAGRSLRRVCTTAAGFTDYRMRLDPEGAAIVEAAIDPLSRPRPDLSADGVDSRSAATRRADALLEIIGRGVAAPEGVTRSPRATLVVTMTLEALMDALRGVGVLDTGGVVTPSTVRRLACEAGIVPMVLGAPSEVLDLGYTRRLFGPAQRRALAARDQGCSFPGCTVPPAWCEAHHVVHWLHGGRTDVGNGALLCGRHHTVVHRRQLTATVTATGVVWHL